MIEIIDVVRELAFRTSTFDFIGRDKKQAAATRSRRCYWAALAARSSVAATIDFDELQHAGLHWQSVRQKSVNLNGSGDVPILVLNSDVLGPVQSCS